MSTKTDTAMDLIPTLRAALAAWDEALDNLSETPGHGPFGRDAVEWAECEVRKAEDDVLIMLAKIENSVLANCLPN